MNSLLVEHLTIRYGTRVVVDDVGFQVPPGTVLGVLGESGSGKSTLARALVGLVRPSVGRISGPAARQLVFQDASASLNPRMTVGATLAEAAALAGVPRLRRAAEVERLLRTVALDPAVAVRRPKLLSGGQRQRVAIARALAVRPQVLIADEVTSALDVSVQAGVLNLIRGLRDTLGLSMVFISHDMAVVRYMADEVVVMRDGRVVEAGRAEAVLTAPEHPYTRDLLAAVPVLRQTSGPPTEPARTPDPHGGSPGAPGRPPWPAVETKGERS